MDAAQLKKLQSPLKENYKTNPEAAIITLKAKGSLDENISCNVETGKAIIKAGLHPATGGDGLLACSGDLLLQALVACAGVTMNAVATAIGIEIKSCIIRAEGDLDFRGTLGVSKEVTVGFKKIKLYFDIDSDADKDQMITLLKLTERYCVVYQTISIGAPIEIVGNL